MVMYYVVIIVIFLALQMYRKFVIFEEIIVGIFIRKWLNRSDKFTNFVYQFIANNHSNRIYNMFLYYVYM